MKQIITTDVKYSILLLPYGSAFFEADDTEDSDYDILMVVKQEDMQRWMML